ncbi:glycosyl hydrolase family 5 [Niveispirillum lacus]|uniref:Glycosyl hydrolase family 5 n=2 Tax=Niveispirillum lacus TaxID=1981099 RepID=A0A255YZH1_9PROT|nr:glycosyl hydrolase family 5 [Niveispirillum lacus]
MPVALLQGLDKVTARTSTFEAPVGEPVSFGQLTLLVKACQKASPIDPPESAAFLDAQEKQADGTVVAVFQGWMFASSPALSAMEHPVYDVWVKDCRKSDSKTRSSSKP